MTKHAVTKKMAGFLGGELSFAAFEDWVVSHLQDSVDSSDSQVRMLMNRLDALLVELGEGVVTEGGFDKTIQGLLSDAETIRRDFGQYSADTQDRTVPLYIVTESDSEFHLVFGQ